MRSALEGRATALLECVGADVAAIQVSYTAEGALAAQLGESLRGTMQEGCVRAIVGALRVGTLGSSGTPLHVVSR